MRIAGSEGFTQICRSETLTPKSISIPDSYQSEGFTTGFAELQVVRASLEIKDINFCTLAIFNY